MVYSLYSLTDTFFVARGVGADAAGAVSLVAPLLLLLGCVSTTAGAGGASVISRALGRQDVETAARTAANCFLLYWLVALFTTVFGLLFLDPLLWLLGATEALLPHARPYARIILLGAVTATGFSGLVRAEGETRFSLLMWAVPALVNVVLDPVFIFVLGWGTGGVALATVLSQIITAALFLRFFFKPSRTSYRIRTVHFRPDRAILGEILTIGLPSLLSQLFSSISIILVNRMLRDIGGGAAISAYGIAARLQAYCLLPVSGVVQGSQPIFGFNYACGRLDRIRQALWYGTVVSTIYGAFMTAVCLLFREVMIGWFLTDSVARTISVQAFAYLILTFAVRAWPELLTAWYQAAGKRIPAVAFPLAGMLLVRIPLLLFLGLFRRLDLIWLSFPLADGILWMVSAILFMGVNRQLKAGGKLHE